MDFIYLATFDANAFHSELLASDLCANINTRAALEPDDLLNLFQSTTTKFIDKYAPVKTTTRRVRNTNVWFNEECRQAKKKTRRLKRLYKTKGKVRKRQPASLAYFTA